MITAGSTFVYATNPSLRKDKNTPLNWFFERNRRFSGKPTLLARLLVLIALSTACVQAQTYTVLYTFTGTPDGCNETVLHRFTLTAR